MTVRLYRNPGFILYVLFLYLCAIFVGDLFLFPTFKEGKSLSKQFLQ